MSEYVLAHGTFYEVNDELRHYGVAGMKWGVRRGNASSAFGKASRKANRIKEDSVKISLKAAKLQKKALKKEMKATNEKQFKKARKIQYKANKKNLKSAKLQKKAMKWEQKMVDVFSTVKVDSISAKDWEAGRQYAYMLSK